MENPVSNPPRFSRIAIATAGLLSLGLAGACDDGDSTPDSRQLTDAPPLAIDARNPTIDASLTDAMAAADASTTDAAIGTPDAMVVIPDGGIVLPDAMGIPDAAIPPDAAPVNNLHLLLSEAVVTPTEAEFIEIFNPSSVAVDLTNYYLSDDEEYALLPGLTGDTVAPNIGTSDFIAQFPAGASIAAGQTITVAFDTTGFVTAYTVEPTYGMRNVTGATLAMVAITPFDAGANGCGITNSGEGIVLFFWDGATDLVSDIDCVNIGDGPSATNDLGDKTGIMVDGPDADTTPSTYLNDSVAVLQLNDSGAGTSTKRIALEGINEVDVAGNGIGGHDETSENFQVTWDADPFSAPTPNVSNIVLP